MASKDPAKPNIVMVLTDDQGFWALGSAGNPEIQTPHIDTLAKEGMRFDNFFCASPVCSPARASLLTGCIPSYHGVHDWIRKGNLAEEVRPGDFFADGQAFPYLEGLTAYTEILAANGYTCGLSGKWHLGDSLTPQKGFSHWFTIPRGGSDYQNARVIHDGIVEIAPGYLTDAITEDALAFLDACNSEANPFYLSVHYNAPHSPWERGQHPEELTSLYRDCDFVSCPQEKAHPWLINASPIGTGEKRRELLSGYYGAMTGVDRSVARLRQKLAEHGWLENTLFIYTGDNGLNLGHHGVWGKGNGTFPQNMYEESVKIPFIISFPGRVAGGGVCRSLLSHYDVMPTLLDWLGMPLPQGVPLPGKSFAALLEGKAIDENEFVVVFDEYGPVRMVRTSEWKYVHRYPFGPHELYCLKEDPGERINRLEDPVCAGILNDLRAVLHEWFVKYGDPDREGVLLPVYGMGQIRLVGKRSGGMPTFDPDFHYIDLDDNPREPPGIK